jgi:hypothetical protein
MEIKLTLPLESHKVLDQLIEQCGECGRKSDGNYMYVVLGEQFNVVVEGYRNLYVTLQIKPERTL